MTILLNWFFLLLVIGVNALANILPINGFNTGQISGFYPNYFVPAGFTFSIWGVIYLLLLNYNIAFTYYTIRHQKFPTVKKLLNDINIYFRITCVLNVSWILAWHYLQITMSVIIMLFFLATLIHIFIKLKKQLNELTLLHRFLIYTPFTVYLGWISVATIANITALLVKYNWSGFGIQGVYWSASMICIAIMLGVFFSIKYKAIAYSAVVAWALWGINASQGKLFTLLHQVSIIGIILLFSAIIFSVLFKKRAVIH